MCIESWELLDNPGLHPKCKRVAEGWGGRIHSGLLGSITAQPGGVWSQGRVQPAPMPSIEMSSISCKTGPSVDAPQ